MLKKCGKCGYTLHETCKCGAARSAHPPKFSASDRYAKYRRMAKKKGKSNN